LRLLHHAQEFLRQQLGPDALSSEPDAAVGFVSTIEDAVREADLAIDCVPDELESKLEIFCLLDRMAPPRTVLATPTTRLSIADLASCTYRADRCVAIAHEASSLADGTGGTLEMRTTSKTSGATVELLTRFWTRTGFIPVFSADPAEFKAEPA
jgi:3-hydroxybutyryl-CoA dehydrogenase